MNHDSYLSGTASLPLYNACNYGHIEIIKYLFTSKNRSSSRLSWYIKPNVDYH